MNWLIYIYSMSRYIEKSYPIKPFLCLRKAHNKCGIYCKAFAHVKKRCANREETLVDMCRVMSKPVFWVIDQVRTNLMTWIMIIMTYICIMWSNAISVRTSAMNSSRQPKIRILKFHGGPCLWQMLKVANTWYILLV